VKVRNPIAKVMHELLHNRNRVTPVKKKYNPKKERQANAKSKLRQDESE